MHEREERSDAGELVQGLKLPRSMIGRMSERIQAKQRRLTIIRSLKGWWREHVEGLCGVPCSLNYCSRALFATSGKLVVGRWVLGLVLRC